MLKRPAIPDILKKKNEDKENHWWCILWKNKTKVRSQGSALPLFVMRCLSAGFTSIHIELRVHSHHFSHCCNTFKSPDPFLVPLYIPGENLNLGQLAACLWGKIRWPADSLHSHKPQWALNTAFFRLYLRGQLVSFSLSSHPPFVMHSQLTNTPHLSLRNQKPLCDISYLLTRKSEPGVHLHPPSLVTTEKVYLPFQSNSSTCALDPISLAC